MRNTVSSLVLVVVFAGLTGTPTVALTINAGCSDADQKDALEVLLKANTLTNHYRYSEAVATLQNAGLSQDPNCPIYAAVLTQTASIEFRAGHTAQAIAAANGALHLRNVERLLDQRRIALLYYVLGGSYSAIHQYEQAEQYYQESIKRTPLGDDEQRARAATIEAELSLLYLQWGRFRDAERSVQKSVELDSKGNKVDKNRQVLRLDTLTHMQVERGRLTDAFRSTKALVAEFATDPEVAIDVRAHLYRDYGELCYDLRRFEESTASLEKCIELEEHLTDWPAAALTLATLARVQTLQGRFEAADLSLRRAQEKIEPFRADHPVNAARVAISAAQCWHVRERWSEARLEALQGAEILRRHPAEQALLQQCLLLAANASHHLGNRGEEKQLRKEAKDLTEVSSEPTQRTNTVDIATLQPQRVR